MSEYSHRAEDIFPPAYGNEEETGLMVNRGDGYTAPDDFLQHAQNFIPEKLRGHGEFLTNGFRVYVPTRRGDRAGLPYNQHVTLERSTPECSTIDEFVASTRASERLLLDMTEEYAKQRSEEDSGTTSIRIQRRVVDSHGNRNGCHDNFALMNPHMFQEQYESESTSPLHIILGHLATRSFVTGAGFVAEEELHFSQKIGGLNITEGQRYSGNMYSNRDNENVGLFEVRCSDVNISDWATRMRIGAPALAIAIAQTPLSETFEDLAEHEQFIDEAIERNRFHLNPDGTIVPNEKLRTSVSYQRKIAETALFDLPDYIGELPEEHENTAIELLAYCNNFDKVLDGEASIDILADRADWAAKFKRIKQEVQSDKDGKRSSTDLDSKARDLMYDHIRVQATNGTPKRSVYGFGYKLRDTDKLKQSTPQRKVEKAYAKAPASTRAHIRAELLKAHGSNIKKCSWGEVMYYDKKDDTFIKVTMSDVRSTQLDEANIKPVYTINNAQQLSKLHKTNSVA